MNSLRRRGGPIEIPTLLVALLSVLLMNPHAHGQNGWEMRVCADPAAYPFSSRESAGIDNRIAQILADELSAELSYVWTPINLGAVRQHLHPGDCDLLMGVAEGAEGVLNTIPYYQAPFVFVYRQDSGLELRSLEDENLRELRIAVNPNGLAQFALSELGLGGSAVTVRPNRAVRGAERITPLIDRVLEGEVDAAIVYGPEAAPFVREHPAELQIEPVTPQIVPPLIQMFRIVTMGVRPGDEAFRDRLNIALGKRWEEIQAVFEEFGVPLTQLPAPFVAEQVQENLIRIGAVLPVTAGQPGISDPLGNAARLGALIAEDTIARGAAASEAGAANSAPKVLIASSPSAAAAERAAERMIATEDVVAIIGGLGSEQAFALNGVAAERDVLFFNLGAIDAELRGAECSRNTFHIEASAAMYLDALAEWFSQAGHARWLVVYEGSEEGRELLEQALLAVDGVDSEVVGEIELPPGPAAYQEGFSAIEEEQADLVLLLLAPRDQELFLSQYGVQGPDVTVTGMPFPVMQTRDYLGRLQQSAPPGARFRAALWDTTLADHGAEELNERFVSRSGEPMDPSGWAAYAAIRIIHHAANEASGTETGQLVDYLESPAAEFNLHKGPGTTFRPHNHQLRQPLYMIELDPDAPWGREVSSRIALADLAGQLPREPDGDAYLERLDRLGESGEQDSCDFQ
ncbi:MAG: ABC transporter substrate-binding protein [Trueperaceae bacterium]